MKELGYVGLRLGDDVRDGGVGLELGGKCATGKHTRDARDKGDSEQKLSLNVRVAEFWSRGRLILI
jgi:hypothetical protein